MTSAIFIIISILCISVALFFIIKKMSSVSKNNVEEYEESSLTEYGNILNIENPLESNTQDDSKIVKEGNINVIFTKILSIKDSIYKNIRSQIFINIEKYKDSRRKKQIDKERIIRASFLESENNQKLLDTDENFDLDNEFLDNPNKIRAFNVNKESVDIKKTKSSRNIAINQLDQEIKKDNHADNKVDSFVEQLLEEGYFYEDVPNKVNLDEEISDSYYYKYMEKRYINKIVKNPRDITSYRKLGDLYLEVKNYTDAIESYKMVLKLKPDDLEIKTKLNNINQTVE